MIALVSDETWIALNLKTGKPRGQPIALGFEPIQPVQYADLDGDGEPEVLAVGPGPGAFQWALSVFSTSAGRSGWTSTITDRLVPPMGPSSPLDGPWLVELKDDGTSTVLVPDAGPLAPGPGYRGLRRLDGRTGKTVWVHPMRPETSGLDETYHVVAAPDLDGDGTRDLVVASEFDGGFLKKRAKGRTDSDRFYIDALSGEDGHPLWSWSCELPPGHSATIRQPRWWARGPDGWPLLAVPLDGRMPSDSAWDKLITVLWPRFRPDVHFLEASTGKEVHGCRSCGI